MTLKSDQIDRKTDTQVNFGDFELKGDEKYQLEKLPQGRGGIDNSKNKTEINLDWFLKFYFRDE